jgi:predicted transcriptional regulator with HTH domain
MISLRSQVTRKILNLFFLNPHETLYVNELSRRLGLDKRNLVKKEI